MSELSPIASEFATTEDAEAYEHWFRGKVRASPADRRPAVPHEGVLAEVDAIIGEADRPVPRSRAPGTDPRSRSAAGR